MSPKKSLGRNIMILRLLSATALVAVIAALPALAQTNEPPGRPAPTQATAPANPRPPYLVSQTEHLFIIFEADESALKSLLPPGVKPAAGNVVDLNMYHVQHVVGLVPYTASYLWINVDGFDSPDGTKGRWMAQGWYGPEPVPTVAKTQMGFPVQLGVTRVEHTGNQLHAVLNKDGADLIDATITIKEGNPAPASTVLNYPVWGA
jgi:acetoacetate decarboxylase